jgi:NTP pyrophosphatase (non-canonical NTP hydrolase)
MNLTEYKIAIREFDCYPPEHQRECLLLGCAAEIGEVLGALDKHGRKCKLSPWTAHECPTCRPKLIDELGDVLWYAVRILDEGEGDLEPVYAGFALSLPKLAWLVAERHQMPHWWPSEAVLHDIIGEVALLALGCGISLEALAQLNVDKLTDRATHAAIGSVIHDADELAAYAEQAGHEPSKRDRMSDVDATVPRGVRWSRTPLREPGVYVADRHLASRAIWDLVIEDMRARDRKGAEEYGTRLHAHNGRDALQDAYEEALDLAVYLRQAIAERDELLGERALPILHWRDLKGSK